MSTRQELHWAHIRQDQLMRGVRKEMERNRDADRVRRKDWLPGDLDDPESWDEVETEQYERVMPRGEQERRRANLKRAQKRSFEEPEPVENDGVEAGEALGADDWPQLLANGSTKSHPGPLGVAGAGEGAQSSAPAQPANGAGAASFQGNGNGSTKGRPGPLGVAGAGEGPQSLAPEQPGAPAGAAGASGGRNGTGPGAGQSRAVPALTRPGLARPGAARPGSDGPGRPDWGRAPGQAAAAPGAARAGAGAAAADPVYPRPVYGHTSRRAPAVEPLPAGYGLVIEAGSGICRVEMGGEILLCNLRGSLAGSETGLTNVLAAGDRVRVTAAGDGRGVVEAVQPRRTALGRPDVFNSHVRQVLAANVDQLLAVAAYENPPLWPELIDRYLITAEVNGLAALICLNKVDLAEDMAEARAAVAPYLALGYPVIFTSAETGYGVDALAAALAGRATVLAGLSGVGKSSLLSAVQPGLHLRVAEVNEHQRLGRHTTTGAALHRLAGGGFVVDTPGIKEWGLAGLGRGDLGSFYPEIAALAGRCRFADCSHLEEPGCAVKSAVRAGRMAQVRYDSYRKIYVTLKE